MIADSASESTYIAFRLFQMEPNDELVRYPRIEVQFFSLLFFGNVGGSYGAIVKQTMELILGQAFV
jgi:hypothetical protein